MNGDLFRTIKKLIFDETRAKPNERIRGPTGASDALGVKTKPAAYFEVQLTGVGPPP